MPDKSSTYSWHESATGTGRGQVLGPHDGTHGYPMLENGVTLEWARATYGEVVVGGEIPIVTDRPTADPTT